LQILHQQGDCVGWQVLWTKCRCQTRRGLRAVSTKQDRRTESSVFFFSSRGGWALDLQLLLLNTTTLPMVATTTEALRPRVPDRTVCFRSTNCHFKAGNSETVSLVYDVIRFLPRIGSTPVTIISLSRSRTLFGIAVLSLTVRAGYTPIPTSTTES